MVSFLLMYLSSIKKLRLTKLKKTHIPLFIAALFTLARTDSDAFLFIAEQHSIVYMYHNFFIRSSVDGHLGCFDVLPTVMNNGITCVFFNFGFLRVYA